MTPTLRILVRRNLKMSSGKVGAQSVHAALGLMKIDPRDYRRCTVLEASDAKFERFQEISTGYYVVTDTGKTEVEPGTQTALAYWEYDEEDPQQVRDTNTPTA